MSTVKHTHNISYPDLQGRYYELLAKANIILDRLRVNNSSGQQYSTFKQVTQPLIDKFWDSDEYLDLRYAGVLDFNKDVQSQYRLAINAIENLEQQVEQVAASTNIIFKERDIESQIKRIGSRFILIDQAAFMPEGKIPKDAFSRCMYHLNILKDDLLYRLEKGTLPNIPWVLSEEIRKEYKKLFERLADYITTPKGGFNQTRAVEFWEHGFKLHEPTPYAQRVRIDIQSVGYSEFELSRR